MEHGKHNYLGLDTNPKKIIVNDGPYNVPGTVLNLVSHCEARY